MLIRDVFEEITIEKEGVKDIYVLTTADAIFEWREYLLIKSKLITLRVLDYGLFVA